MLVRGLASDRGAVAFLGQQCIHGANRCSQRSALITLALKGIPCWRGAGFSLTELLVVSLTGPFRLSRGIAGSISGFMPSYLLLGSYTAVIWLWLRGRMSKTIASVKMFCPSCGAHIEFASQNSGRKIARPLCQTTLTLRMPTNLKMSCSFCREYIQFPAHAKGQKIPCPHCNMEITLKEPS